MWVAVERTKTSKYLGNISTNYISKEWVTEQQTNTSKSVGKSSSNQHFKTCGQQFNKPTLQIMWVIVQQTALQGMWVKEQQNNSSKSVGKSSKEQRICE
jgi:hypothetical protein